MIENYKAVLNKYADFTGRARRSEYWYFVLANILIYFVLAFLGGLIGGASGGETGSTLGMIPVILFALAVLIPSIAVAVRRLHDSGKSGWWLLISLIPFGGIVLLVFYCMDSEPGANKWGPNPKTGATADAASHLVD